MRSGGVMRRCVVGVLLLAFLGASRVARADPDATRANGETAPAAYQRAVRYSILGRHDEAEKSYEAAFLETADPRLLVDIGHSYRLMHRHTQAIRSFAAY